MLPWPHVLCNQLHEHHVPPMHCTSSYRPVWNILQFAAFPCATSHERCQDAHAFLLLPSISDPLKAYGLHPCSLVALGSGLGAATRGAPTTGPSAASQVAAGPGSAQPPRQAASARQPTGQPNAAPTPPAASQELGSHQQQRQQQHQQDGRPQTSQQRDNRRREPTNRNIQGGSANQQPASKMRSDSIPERQGSGNNQRRQQQRQQAGSASSTPQSPQGRGGPQRGPAGSLQNERQLQSQQQRQEARAQAPTAGQSGQRQGHSGGRGGPPPASGLQPPTGQAHAAGAQAPTGSTAGVSRVPTEGRAAQTVPSRPPTRSGDTPTGSGKQPTRGGDTPTGSSRPPTRSAGSTPLPGPPAGPGPHRASTGQPLTPVSAKVSLAPPPGIVPPSSPGAPSGNHPRGEEPLASGASGPRGRNDQEGGRGRQGGGRGSRNNRRGRSRDQPPTGQCSGGINTCTLISAIQLIDPGMPYHLASNASTIANKQRVHHHDVLNASQACKHQVFRSSCAKKFAATLTLCCDHEHRVDQGAATSGMPNQTSVMMWTCHSCRAKAFAALHMALNCRACVCQLICDLHATACSWHRSLCSIPVHFCICLYPHKNMLTPCLLYTDAPEPPPGIAAPNSSQAVTQPLAGQAVAAQGQSSSGRGGRGRGRGGGGRNSERERSDGSARENSQAQPRQQGAEGVSGQGTAPRAAEGNENRPPRGRGRGDRRGGDGNRRGPDEGLAAGSSKPDVDARSSGLDNRHGDGKTRNSNPGNTESGSQQNRAPKAGHRPDRPAGPAPGAPPRPSGASTPAHGASASVAG